jgi:hypothetical protein
MRFTIEIPDELFHATGSLTQPSVTLSQSDASSDAMSGGAGPGGGPDGVAVDLAANGLSAGAAEQYATDAAPATGGLAANDGGPGPAPAR